MDLAACCDAWAAMPLAFQPGAEWLYSVATDVLGRVVEVVSSQSLDTFFEERIFGPLGMTGSVAHVEGQDTVPHRAFGASQRNGKWIKTDQSNTSAVLGDGGVYTNVNDLAKWVQALFTAPLPGVELQQRAWTPFTLNDGTPGPYGFGYFVDTDRGLRRLSHHGETRGFTNALVIYPDKRVAVILLTNRIGGDPWVLAQQVADRELGLTGARAPFRF